MKQYSDMSQQFLKVVTTWCFTLLIMNSSYIAFTFYEIADVSLMTTSQQNSCIIIGVFLHFFLITSFCLAMSISIIQYFIFYKSFKIFKYIYLKAVLFSLVVPITAVSIVLGIDKNAYINTNKYCWLNSPYSIYTVIIPIGLIMIVNVTFFLIIVVNYSKISKKRDKYVHVRQETEVEFKRGIRKEILLILTCFLNSSKIVLNFCLCFFCCVMFFFLFFN